jgi:hypothetical protein
MDVTLHHAYPRQWLVLGGQFYARPLYLGRKSPRTNCTGKWVDIRTDLGAMQKREISCHVRNRIPEAQPAVSRYIVIVVLVFSLLLFLLIVVVVVKVVLHYYYFIIIIISLRYRVAPLLLVA